jgi:hypothetical protein
MAFADIRFIPKFVFNLLLLAVLLLVGGCASVVAPSGGPKDVAPPKMLSETPPALTTHFSEKTIVFTFDEFIQIKDKDKQVVISPIMKPAPEMTVKGKKLIVTLKSPLKDSSTYTINFGNAICDLHEGNALSGFSYVFSTGDYVDTLSLRGNVLFAETNNPEKDVLVMLYTTFDDSLPYLSTPSFITRTDDKGNFKINNINHGPFKIFALKDADNNYKFNSSDESVAFLPTPVTAGDSTPIQLRLFKEEETKLYVKESKPLSPLSARIILNKPSSAVILPLDSSSKAIRYTDYGLNRDTVILWFNDTLKDTLKVVVKNNGVVFDTLSLNKSVSSKRTAGKLTVAMPQSTLHIPGSLWQLQSSLPLDSIRHDKITIMLDSVKYVAFTDSFSAASPQYFYLNAGSKEKTKYRLTLLPGALKSIYQTTNDTTIIDVTTAAFTDLGSIKIKLSGLKNGKYVLQLVDEKDNALTEKIITSDGIYLFENLSPVKCRIKLIDDTDGNGKFTTGNYLKSIQPEKCYYYGETITVRANWDIETDWNVKMQ